MSTPEQDQPDAQRAVDAVRAADPAAGTAPDLARLRAALAGSTGLELLADEPAEVVDELAVRRARRTPRWIQAAAAVAGVAIVGSAGYAIGTQHDTDPQATNDVPAAISLEQQGRNAAGTTGELGAPTRDMAAPANPAGLAGPSSKIAAGYFGGHIVFTGKGLSSAGGSHDAWAYDAASVYSATTAARLASALGVEGRPHEDWGWTVGANDGTAAMLTLAPDGTASMSYYDPAKDPWACADKSALDAPADEPAVDPAASGSAPDDVATDIGKGVLPECDAAPAPQGAKAEAKANDVLASLGVDTDALVLEVQPDGEDRATTVVAYPVVDGQRTDLPWSVTLVADGTSSVNGPVAPLVALGSYDVVSPAQAVERLNDPRFGSSSGAIPYAAREGVADTAASSLEPTTPAPPTVPPTVEPGSPIGWPVTDVTLTKARLGLATHTEPSGSTTLVPSYELTGDDGSTWSVIAVVDQQLDTASR